MSAPRVRNGWAFVVQAVLFSIVEVAAAIRLDGWVSFALWAIAVLNVLRLVLFTHGLIVAAAAQLADQ